MRLRRSSKWPGVRRDGNLILPWAEEYALRVAPFHGPKEGSIEEKWEEYDFVSGKENTSIRTKPKLEDFLTASLDVSPVLKERSSSDTTSQSTNSGEPTVSILSHSDASSLERAVMELQAKFNDYAATQQKRGDSPTTTTYEGCYLYDTLIRVGQSPRQQTILLQSPAAAAFVCFSPGSNRYGPYQLVTNTSSQPHVDFLEDLVRIPDSEPFDFDLLAEAWKDIPGNIERNHTDRLSKALSGCSLVNNGNLNMAHWLKAAGGSLGGQMDNLSTTNESQKCPICLEHFDGIETIVQLDGCGHRFCLECALSYMRSCPRGQLPCPAGGGCETTMGVVDMVHLSAAENASKHGPTSDDDTLQNILRRELEQYCLVDRNGKHCLHCPRLLASSSPSMIDSGWDILHCACATQTVCGNCHQRSHPGVSCSEYERSLPCPQCQFAIEKDGGCNHVRCTKCDYYFCFQCGGPGNDCMAFYCEKKRKYWHQNNSEEAPALTALKKHQKVYVRYRLLEKRLEQTDQNLRRLGSDGDSSLLLLERQITLVQLWVQGYLLMQKAKSDEDARRCLTRLELVRQASYFRQHGQTISEIKAADLVNNFLGEDVDEYTLQKAVLDLMDVTTSKSKSFEAEVVAAFQCAVDSLPNDNKSARHSRKRVVKKKLRIGLSGTAELNQRVKRSADPWRHGFRRTGPRGEPALRWKGKLKRSRRRFIERALDA